MRIRTLFTILFNGIAAIIVLAVSFLFYNEFQRSLDERILLQLSSIKNLKSNHIEKYINSIWEDFKIKNASECSFIDSAVLPQFIQEDGIYDVTPFSQNNKTILIMIKSSIKGFCIDTIDFSMVNSILQERTGMGNSGETYLVGKDFRLRSPSRFFNDEVPYTIKAQTIGVMNAFLKEGVAIFPDYRSILVYSSYDKLKIPSLGWVILSEIDVAEASGPLRQMRVRLNSIAFIILICTFAISVWVSRAFSFPINNMALYLRNMSKGNYDIKVELSRNNPKEIIEMYESMKALKKSLEGAILFSKEIGEMKLNSMYDLSHKEDQLGKSLLQMRDQLVAYREKEKINRILSKKLVMEGEENERNRLARELHDGIGPMLTSLKYMISGGNFDSTKKAEAMNVLDATIGEIRQLTNALMPQSLVDFGVGRALENFVGIMQRSSGIQIIYEDLTKHNDSKISTQASVALYRISQELINNTLKHSHANKIVLTLSELDDFASLYYFENGEGYDPETIKQGSGLINISERVEALNGEAIYTLEKENVVVEIEIPL